MCLAPKSVLRIALPMFLLLLPLAPFGGVNCARTIAGLRQYRSDEATGVAHVSAGKSRRAVVVSELSKWPMSVLPYTISDTLDKSGKAVVAAAIDAYTKQSCVQIRPWTGERDYVTFTRGSSCSSQIGRGGSQQFIFIGSDCEVAGKVMHEIFHALGRWHEHCRPDRDQYVKINWDNIIPGNKAEFRLATPEYTTVQGLPYDYDSIMHYETTAFSFTGQPTIQPLNVSVSSDRLGQRENFSPIDLQHLAIMYCNGWGQWTPWEECSVGCGGGVRRRSRMCASKVLCGGDEIQEEPCNLEPCPVWSDWSGWMSCNVSCGHGYQRRTRVCINGSMCRGESVETVLCLGTVCTSANTPTPVPSANSTISPSLTTITTKTTPMGVVTTITAKTTPMGVVTSTSAKTTPMGVVTTITAKTTPMGVVTTTPSKTTPMGVVTIIIAKTTASQPASDLRPTPTPVSMGTLHTADSFQWSLCSRPCGGGTQFNMTAASQVRPCNTQPCLLVACAQLCSTGQYLLGLRNQDCLSNGSGSQTVLTTNRTLTLHPQNTTSQGGGSLLLRCVLSALTTGYSRFAIITEQCYLGDGSLLNEAPPTNCTKPCVLQERLVGCFYEITDSVLLKRSVENIAACQANNRHDSSVCSGVPRQQSHHVQSVMIATVFLLGRLL